MNISVKTITVHIILLDTGERFTIRPPRSWRTWSVNIIEVGRGHFFFLGGPGRNSHASYPVDHGYRSVYEVPTMPALVAEKVQRILDTLER